MEVTGLPSTSPANAAMTLDNLIQLWNNEIIMNGGFNIEGEGEGAFYAEVKDGKLYIEPYEYYDRDVIFICSADTLFKIIDGEMDSVWAFTTGKLKLKGDIGKALRLKDMIKK